VPTVQPFYERAHAAIVPVLYGSGTRLKVIEAMAYRRPVVATSAGVEGLPIFAGRHYFRADEPEAFASALLKVAKACERRDGGLEQMIAAARGAIEPLLWPHIVDELSEHYLAATASRR
jgi:glycosyltransferase involved in cell wall biosynthesis